MSNQEEKKLVKVLSVKQSYKIEDRNYITTAVPDCITASVTDVLGNVSVIRTPDFINVGDEIEIVSKAVKEYEWQPEIVIMTKVLRNFTQQKKIKDFVKKQKVKSI